MNYLDLLKTVAASETGEWQRVGGHVGVQLHRGDGELLEHTDRWIYSNDVNIALVYGMDSRPGTPLRFDAFLALTQGDVIGVSVQLLYAGQPVYWQELARVDGGRAIMPLPRFKTLDTQAEVRAETCTETEHDIARLLDRLVQHESDFDRYMERAGIIVLPGTSV